MPRVRFCGGCNPVIDRLMVARALGAEAAEDGSVLYVSGCLRACASGHRSVLDEVGAVVVAGSLVNGQLLPAVEGGS